MQKRNLWLVGKLLVAAIVAIESPTAHAGVVLGFSGPGLDGGVRWDAAPRTIAGLERSLDGGLRYSVSGGSYQALRDSFTWNTMPSAPQFQAAVEQAFNAWTITDPISGSRGMFSFVSDFGTPVDTAIVGGVRQGAEIDIFAFNFGDNGTRGDTFFNVSGSTVTLTSGTTGYAASAINGVDIRINSNPGAVYNLDLFRRLLTHEIGHAIGLGDVEGDINPAAFIDDDMDLTDSSTALASLTNPWAHLVDPLNPAASPLNRYTATFGDPGLTTPGVDILMESRGLGIGPSNLITNLSPLTNDEFGTRQFLYPDANPVPEPTSMTLLGLSAVGMYGYVRRRRKASAS